MRRVLVTLLGLAAFPAVAAPVAPPPPPTPPVAQLPQPSQPDLDKPTTTTLRKVERMLAGAYNRGYAAGLDAAAQSEGSQEDVRDIVRQAAPSAKK